MTAANKLFGESGPSPRRYVSAVNAEIIVCYFLRHYIEHLVQYFSTEEKLARSYAGIV